MEQLEEIVRFEEEEQDRYLATYFPFEEVRNYFPDIDNQQYQQLVADTKRGIRHGVHDHLEKVNPSSQPRSIYFVDVREFCLRHDLARFLQSELSERYTGYRDSYCREVGGGYGSFLYNYSLDEFRKRFSTFSTLLSDYCTPTQPI